MSKVVEMSVLWVVLYTFFPNFVVAWSNLVSAQGPLDLGFWVLGPGLDNIKIVFCFY